MIRLRPRGIRNPLAVWVLASLTATAAHAIGISFQTTSGGTLEDAILIASIDGDPPRALAVLGDFDLSTTEHIVDVPVDGSTTHWWLIGHEGSNVVYSSTLDLLGVDMYSIEPYDIPGAELAWNIPGNLEGLVNGTGYSLDWYAQTVNNHSSHVTGDGDISQLWRFGSPGEDIGYVAVSIHTNTPPFVPEPASLFLLGLGALVMIMRRKR